VEGKHPPREAIAVGTRAARPRAGQGGRARSGAGSPGRAGANPPGVGGGTRGKTHVAGRNARQTSRKSRGTCTGMGARPLQGVRAY